MNNNNNNILCGYVSDAAFKQIFENKYANRKI